ncbi:transposon protein [Nesidiocoris tenuis]|uniref:Transposon protein n=1 Tax=Nesidiocoris tenuis TaxID=355587 RepID=A0ABN7B4I9_9HEMI|nr:transposon protein [Nesidiocoris tenuis]
MDDPTDFLPRSELSSRGKRPSTEEQHQGTTPKKAKLEIDWTDTNVSALLHYRQQMSRNFEQNRERATIRAWSRISTILTPYLSCSGQDCRKKFDSLLFEYLLLKDSENEGNTHAKEWKYYGYFEKLFESSQTFANQYKKFYEPLAVDEEAGDELLLEYDDSAMEAFDTMSKFDIDIALAYVDVKDMQRKRFKRLRKLENLCLYLKYLREENDYLMTTALKKITENFSRDDESKRQWCLRALALSSAFSMSDLFTSVLPSFYVYFNQMHSREDQITSIALAYFTYLQSVSKLLCNDDHEKDVYDELISLMEWDALNSPIVKPLTTLETLNFKAHLNLFSSTVEILIQRIGCFLKTVNFSRPMSIERQIILCIWYLTHRETIEQISVRFEVRYRDAEQAITSVLMSIVLLEYLIEWPRQPSELKRTVLAFEKIGEIAFPGVAGAVGLKNFTVLENVARVNDDDSSISIVPKTHHIGVQVVVDTKLIFTNAYINRIDSSNRDEFDSDSDDVPNRWQESMGSFYRMSALGRCLRKTNAAEDDEFFLPGGYHLVGDCTYPLSTRLMVPFGQSGNDDSKIKYDKYLHKARCHVDQALGKLIARFPRIEFLDLEMNTNVFMMIRAMIMVHNLCMTQLDDVDGVQIQLPDDDFIWPPTYSLLGTNICLEIAM